MYNRLDKYLIENNVLCFKQSGFQNGHSTDNAVAQLVVQIIESFVNNKYILGVLINLWKTFDTADHSIFSKNWNYLYGITDRNYEWVKIFLSNSRQFIQINEKEKACSETISCGVPQGSIFGPLSFVLYVNLKMTPTFFCTPRYYIFVSNSKPRVRKHQPMVYFK